MGGSAPPDLPAIRHSPVTNPSFDRLKGGRLFGCSVGRRGLSGSMTCELLWRVSAGLIGICALLARPPSRGDRRPRPSGPSTRDSSRGRSSSSGWSATRFPSSTASPSRRTSTTQRQAFDRDFLTEHGGETQVQPTMEMVFHRGQGEHRWRKVDSPTDASISSGTSGYEQYAITYAWARIDMPAETPAVLGIGSDDAREGLAQWRVDPRELDEPRGPGGRRPRRGDVPGRRQLPSAQDPESRPLWGLACRLVDADVLGDQVADGPRAAGTRRPCRRACRTEPRRTPRTSTDSPRCRWPGCAGRSRSCNCWWTRAPTRTSRCPRPGRRWGSSICCGPLSRRTTP